MIFLGMAGHGSARLGAARQYVTWYGNQDNFLGTARPGKAWRGGAGLG